MNAQILVLNMWRGFVKQTSHAMRCYAIFKQQIIAMKCSINTQRSSLTGRSSCLQTLIPIPINSMTSLAIQKTAAITSVSRRSKGHLMQAANGNVCSFYVESRLCGSRGTARELMYSFCARCQRWRVDELYITITSSGPLTHEFGPNRRTLCWSTFTKSR